MDKRLALAKGTILDLRDDVNKASYKLDDEIGRGGSCIVYRGSYETNAGTGKKVLIKEFYPAGLHLKRKGSTLVTDREYEYLFKKRKSEFFETFIKTNELFSLEGLTNSITNTIDIYSKNNTFYVVTVISHGMSLDRAASDMSLSSKITAVLSITEILKKIHKAGYLYLDLKPSNVFIFPETTELVQLFDFDTLTKIGNEKKSGRISYTRGFAPVELASGRLSDTGVWTDFYETGALLYWLLTGRTPGIYDKPELENAPVFKESYFSDRLFSSLDKFFKGTLAPFYKDRFRTDDELADLLNDMKKYSDPKQEYIVSSYVEAPEIFSGREKDLEKFENFADINSKWPFFCTLSGLGGMGKSTFIRKYLDIHKGDFDTALLLYYKGNMREMISDDLLVHISTVKKDNAESGQEYYRRKIRKLKEICSSKKIIIVVDNFYSKEGEDFSDILNLGASVIFITREKNPALEIPVFTLGPVENTTKLFTEYLGRSISKEEMDSFYKLSRLFHNHTLTVKLMAKQIKSGKLSLAEALSLAGSMSLPAVYQEKDSEIFYGKIVSLLSELLSLSSLPEKERAGLFELSLVDLPGIRENDMEKFSGIGKENFKHLQNLGWIESEEGLFSVHPVITEVVRRWTYDPVLEESTSLFLNNISTEIIKADKIRNKAYGAESPEDTGRLPENCRNYSEYVVSLIHLSEGVLKNGGFPESLWDENHENSGNFESSGNYVNSRNCESTMNYGSSENCESTMNYEGTGNYENSGNFRQVLYKKIHSRADGKNRPAKRKRTLSNISENDLNKLAYSYIQIMPQDEEKRMLDFCDSVLLHSKELSANQILNLRYQKAYVYDQQERPDRAFREISKAFKDVMKSLKLLLISEYYWELASEMSEMYDYKKTVHYLRLSESFAKIAGGRKGARQEAFCHIREAHWLMQVFSSKDSGRIRELIGQCGKYIKRYSLMDDTDIMYSYYGDKAFFLALFRNGSKKSFDNAVNAMEKGIHYVKNLCTSDLFHVENIELMRFEIYYLFGEREKALEALNDGEKLCRRHPGEEPYEREMEFLKYQEKILEEL